MNQLTVALLSHFCLFVCSIHCGYISLDDLPVQKIEKILYDKKAQPELIPAEKTKFNPEMEITFRLYTKTNPTAPQIIKLGEVGTINTTNFNLMHPTKILIHGLFENKKARINSLLLNAYFEIGEFNIITVDWGAGASQQNHNLLIQNVRLVGPYVARLIDWLFDVGSLDFNLLSVIGYSLGAHISGIAGKKTLRGKINTIVALDPILPMFSIDRPDDRVAPTDADYVEVIHTSGGEVGFDEPIGTADFYPNGGRIQPGCDSSVDYSCSHSRVLSLYAESIFRIDKTFTSVQCANYTEILNNKCTPSGPSVNMGGEPSNYNIAKGIYYLTTNSKNPYSIY